MTTYKRVPITRGDTNIIPFHATDRYGNNIRLRSGTVIRFTAKHSFGDTDANAVIVKTLDDGDIVLHSDTTTGLGDVVLDPADTSSLLGVVQQLVYDIQVTEISGQVTSIQRGVLIISPDVSITTT